MSGWFADTLAKRLFALMCAALVGSHLIAFVVVRAVSLQPPAPVGGSSFDDLPTFPSLPPTPGIPELRSALPPRTAPGEPGGGPPPDRGAGGGGARTPPADAAARFDRPPPDRPPATADRFAPDAPPDAARPPPPGRSGPDAAPGARPPPPDRSGPDAAPGAAPPGRPPPGAARTTAGGAPARPALPTDALLLDYAVRFAVIAIAAWFGSRWLALPMQRLVQASRALGSAVSGAAPAELLDDRRGTREVRETARVFNEMATELRQQFRSRGLMVAAISHDLRTPLTRLRMRLHNDGGMAPEPRQRSVDDIHEMSALIDNVLEVFRLDGGAAASDPAQPLDVDALLQSLVDDLAEQGQPVSYHGGPAVTIAQPAALRRVVDNLVANALRYGERADLRLRVADGLARLSVDDTGPGIAADELEAVFEPFYRVEASRNQHTGGTGLGLYIARELTRRQRGTLTLTNRPAGGLRAELTLPLHGPDIRRGGQDA